MPDEQVAASNIRALHIPGDDGRDSRGFRQSCKQDILSWAQLTILRVTELQDASFIYRGGNQDPETVSELSKVKQLISNRNKNIDLLNAIVKG